MKHRDYLIKYARRTLQGKGSVKINSPLEGRKLNSCLEKITGEIDNFLADKNRNKKTNDFQRVAYIISQYAPYTRFESPVFVKKLVHQFSGSYIPGEEIRDSIENSRNEKDLMAKLKELDTHYGVEQIIKESKELPFPRYFLGENHRSWASWKEKVRLYNALRYS